MNVELESKLIELIPFAKKHGLEEMVGKDRDLKIPFRRELSGFPRRPGAPLRGESV